MANVFNPLVNNGVFTAVSRLQQGISPRQEADSRVSALTAAAELDLFSDGSPFQTYLKNVQDYSVSPPNESEARSRIARSQRDSQVGTMLDNRAELGVMEGPYQATFESLINDNLEERSNWALEETGLENLSAYARIERDLSEDTTELDALLEWDIRHAMWQRLIDRVVERREDRPWGYAALEMLGLQSLPFYTSHTMAGTEEDRANLLENVFSGQQLRDQSAEFHAALDGMSREEQWEYMNAVAESLAERAGTAFGAYQDETLLTFMMEELWDPLPAYATNTFNALDNVPIVGWAANWARRSARTGRAGARILRASPEIQAELARILDDSPSATRNTSSVLGPMERQGGRQEAADVVAGAARVGEAEGVDAGAAVLGSNYKADLYSSVSLSALNPWGPTTSVSLSEDVAERLAAAGGRTDLYDAGARLTGALRALLPTSRLNQSEFEAAVEAADARLAELTNNRPLRDVSVVSRELDDNTVVSVVTGTMGRSDGRPFASATTAERAAREMGLPVSRIRERPEGYWVEMELPVRETGFYSSPLEMRSGNPFSRWLLNGRISRDRDATAAAVLGDSTMQRFNRDVIRPLMEQSRRAGAEVRAGVAQIWQLGANQQRWFTRHEFSEMWRRAIPSDDSNIDTAWDLYVAHRRMNDIDYRIRNAAVYRQMQTEGYEGVRIPGVLDEQPAVRISQAPDGHPIWDVANDQILDTLEAGVEDGYTLLRLQDSVLSPSGYRVQTVLVRNADAEFTPLRRNILPYAAGGHRMPQGNWFVRQAIREAQPDGRQVLLPPRTYIGSMVPSEAREWAEVMNQAQDLLRRMVREGEDVMGDLVELLEGRRGYPSIDSLVAEARSGRFNLDDGFEVMEGRALPEAYQRVDPATARFLDDNELQDSLWARGSGGMYYGRRGSVPLQDFQGDQVRTLNLYEMMNRSLSNISRLVGFGNYKQELINRFNETYRRYVLEAERLSPEDLFFRGEVRSDAPLRVRESFQAQREQVLRILGQQTPFARTVEELQRRFIDFVDRQGGRRAGKWVADRVEWWNAQNPVEGLRGAAFDIKLGLFNVAQFPLQVSTMLAIQQLAPVHGTRAFLNVLPGRAALINPDFVETLISRGWHQTVGMTAEDYRAYMDLVRRSGFARIDGQHALINETGTASAMDNFAQSGVDIARERARFFFNEAETFNRLTASHVAFLETRQQFPNLAADHPDFIRAWIGRSDDYSFNMSRAAGANWQHGLLSIPTQFWSYSARMMEAMVGPNFTARQKISLVLGQSLYYGMYGIPLATLLGFTAEQFGLSGDPSGDAPDLATPEAFIQRGLMDHVVNWTTGLDLKVSERIGVGTLAETIVRDMTNSSEYGDTSFLDVVGGATFSIWGDVASDLFDAANYIAAEAGNGNLDFMQNETRARDSVIRLAQNVSSFNNTFRGYMLHRYGVYVTTNYGERPALIENLPSDYAFAAALFSYQPGALDELGADFDYLTDERREDRVRDGVGFLQEYRRRFLEAQREQDTERMQEITDEMAFWMEIEDPELRAEILRRAGDDWGGALASQIAEQVERRQRRSRAYEEVNN